MKHHTVHIALVSVAGAFIGGVVSYELITGYWWTLGTLVGSLVGYIGYDLKGFWSGITTAYQHARGWRPNRRWWTLFSQGFSLYVGCFVSIYLWIFTPILFLLGGKFFLINLCVSLVLTWITFIHFATSVMISSWENGKASFVRKARKFWSYSNPVAFPITIYRLVLSVLWEGVQAVLEVTPVFIRFLKRFVVLVFRYTHSDGRVLCALASAIGTTGGYLNGGIMGIFVGVGIALVCAVVSRELIAKRLLGIEVTQVFRN